MQQTTKLQIIFFATYAITVLLTLPLSRLLENLFKERKKKHPPFLWIYFKRSVLFSVVGAWALIWTGISMQYYYPYMFYEIIFLSIIFIIGMFVAIKKE